MKQLLIEDLDFGILPGGCAEPVLHVPAVIVIAVVAFWPATPAN